MAEPNMIYKITVLRLLSQAGASLSNAQIAQFFSEKEYTDYFTVQQVISDLEEAGYLEVISQHHHTLYKITPQGSHTLSLMRDKLTHAIEEDIKNYLSENEFEIKTDNALTANYDKAVGGGYIVHCKFTQEGQIMLDLTLHASTLPQAKTICNNWKARHEDVYMRLMDTLIS